MNGIELEKKVTIREIAEEFHLEQLTGNALSLERAVKEPDINRPGFELSGYVRRADPERIVLIGNKEIEYISHMSSEDQYARFRTITEDKTPCIIITRNNPLPEILREVADERNFPIFRTDRATGRLLVDLVTYLDEKLAPEDTIHGVLMVVYGKGVLITGDSGVGKSEAALELIRRGQTLVADDRVDILRVHNELIGTAPELLKGMLEIRGIGIINVERMFGATCYVSRHKIDLQIQLIPMAKSPEYDRIGDDLRRKSTYLGMEIPTICLPVSPGRSTSVLVESAVSNFILQEEGYNSASMFKERLMNYLNEKNRENKETGNDESSFI